MGLFDSESGVGGGVFVGGVGAGDEEIVGGVLPRDGV